MTSFKDRHPGLQGKEIILADTYFVRTELDKQVRVVYRGEPVWCTQDVDATQIDKEVLRKYFLDKFNRKGCSYDKNDLAEDLQRLGL